MSTSDKRTAIVLAAGAGTRMRSARPKPAHEILGKPLVEWVLDAARDAGIDDVVAVLGHGREVLEPLVEGRARIAYQESRLGTGDAVAVARDACEHTGSILVLSGDAPLISADSLRRLIEEREATGAAMALLTMRPADPTGYGRIVRTSRGTVERIVEERDATDAERAIAECNAGFYCFDGALLFEGLSRITPENSQGEYYLTDLLGLFVGEGRDVVAIEAEDAEECLGVNSRSQLAAAAKALQHRVNARLMDEGVTLIDPDLVWVSPDATIEQDVELWPMTFVFGNSTVASDCVIGPNTTLRDSRVGPGCKIEESILDRAELAADVSVGPRAYLRPGTRMMERSKAGTHVEIKNSTVGPDSKVPHLTYLGDATLGARVNIGAGAITCNYDGVRKHPTTIGDDVFVGSDTMLVAPVTVGDRALIGAGSTIVSDVAPGALGLARARQVEIPDYVSKREGGSSS